MPQQSTAFGSSPTLSELMTTGVVTLSPDDSLRRAVEVLSAHKVSGAPVVVGQEVVGVLSVTDVIAFQGSTPGVPAERPDQVEWGEWQPAEEWVEGEEPPAAYFLELWEDAGAPVDERFRASSGPEWDVLEEHTVSEVMSQRVFSLPPEATAQEASAQMLRLGIHRILVMDGSRLLGVVSATDMLRAVAASSPADSR